MVAAVLPQESGNFPSYPRRSSRDLEIGKRGPEGFERCLQRPADEGAEAIVEHGQLVRCSGNNGLVATPVGTPRDLDVKSWAHHPHFRSYQIAFDGTQNGSEKER